MGVKSKIAATAVICLLVGAVGVRAVLRATPLPQATAEQRTLQQVLAENRMLKEQVARLSAANQALSTASPGTAAANPSAPTQASRPDAETAAPEAAVRKGLQGASDVAELLGLDAVRRQRFADLYEETLGKLQDEEMRRASVRRDKDRVTLRIPAFPEEARRLEGEWGRVLDWILAASERANYEKFHLQDVLFPRGFGTLDRVTEFTVKARPEEITFEEKWAPPGEEPRPQSTWGGYATAVRCYRRFLSLAECQVSR